MNQLPNEIRNLLVSTAQMLAFALVPAVLGSLAYGLWVGVKMWLGISAVVVVSSLWAYRSDIANYFNRR